MCDVLYLPPTEACPLFLSAFPGPMPVKVLSHLVEGEKVQMILEPVFFREPALPEENVVMHVVTWTKAKYSGWKPRVRPG